MDEFYMNQIPPFGNWDYSDGMPITQYFESARDLYGGDELLYCDHLPHHDLYTKPTITVVSHRRTKGAGREKRHRQVRNKEHKKQGRVYDVTEPAKQLPDYSSSVPKKLVISQPLPPRRAPQAVDEDLYKIPPELLHRNSKRKSKFGFLSCLIPTCGA